MGAQPKGRELISSCQGGDNLRKAIRSVCVLLTVICTVVFSFCISMSKKLPDDYIFNKNEKLTVARYGFMSFRKNRPDTTVSCSLGNDFSDGKLMFMNIIPVKDVNLHMQEKKYVVPCGNIFGIKFYSKGAVIIKCADVSDNFQNMNPGTECGLKAGDTIIKINGEKVMSCMDVEAAVKLSGGDPISITYDRSGSVSETTITPVRSSENEYRLGLWIRDSCAGLGTMTFYDPDLGCFASLGHGICDSDTGNLMILDKATITDARISSITKGTDGITGSINGYFADDRSIGYAVGNTDTGLYGKLSVFPSENKPIEIANIQDVKKGPAQILCTLDDEGPKYYDIEITRVDYDENNKTKNLQITATDERLLAKTGGIIQGMSGSPILQNGKLIGAVTHVLVTNSSKGYGIFAQNMYTEMENCLMEGNYITDL